MASQPRFSFALEYVTDLEAAKRFYVDVLGFEVERAAPDFVQFKQQFAIATDESMDGRNQLELYWVVDDVEATFNSLPTGANISLPLSDRPFGKVFGIKDPTGEPRYFAQFSQNRPSKPA